MGYIHLFNVVFKFLVLKKDLSGDESTDNLSSYDFSFFIKSLLHVRLTANVSPLELDLYDDKEQDYRSREFLIPFKFQNAVYNLFLNCLSSRQEQLFRRQNDSVILSCEPIANQSDGGSIARAKASIFNAEIWQFSGKKCGILMLNWYKYLKMKNSIYYTAILIFSNFNLKMKNLYLFIFVVIFLANCKNTIKNSDASIDIEEGVKLATEDAHEINEKIIIPEDQNQESEEEEKFLGFWVGYFEKDSEGDIMFIDEGYMWNRSNKINISIDKIKENKVTGHSVVAGNDRPFEGEIKEESDGSFTFHVKEPGDDRYDGTFSFNIKNSQLSGTWNAYKKIEIPKRKYTLEKKTFTYNPDIELQAAKEYVDWNKKVEVEEKIEMDENEFDIWVSTQFSTATDLIYKVNASNRLLEKSEVENMKKGDLTIIRNTIYARHGYSYKNRPLRVFFDAQDWYIPVHSNIKGDFTDIEKENIMLLLKYEQNAAEYYDSFGRG